MSARALFNAVCDECKELRPRCARCTVAGTNGHGAREVRDVTLCGPCRRKCRGRLRLHPRHQSPPASPPDASPS